MQKLLSLAKKTKKKKKHDLKRLNYLSNNINYYSVQTSLVEKRATGNDHMFERETKPGKLPL